MIFFVGIILQCAGVWLIFHFIKVSRRPKVEDAKVIDAYMEFYVRKGQASSREFPHADVEYFYRSVKYTNTILLKSKRTKAGDTLTLSINPDKPEDSEEYLPGRELLAIVILNGLAIGVLISCFSVMEILE